MLELCCKLFLCFILFAFIGWDVETLLYVIRDRKVVKRGFLFGPVCPIYGVGALMGTIIIKTGITNSFWIFYIGMVLCGIMEYITHFVMEKAFKAMWWDYSDRMFNINGRVYIKGLIFFGFGMLFMVKYLLPPIYAVMDMLPVWALGLITFVIYTLLVVDITTTIADLKDTVNTLKSFLSNTINKGQEGLDDISNVITTAVDKTKGKIKESESLSTITNSIKTEYNVLDRIKRRYPNFNLERYKQELEYYFGPEATEKGKEGIVLHGDSKISDTEPCAKNEDENENEEQEQ